MSVDDDEGRHDTDVPIISQGGSGSAGAPVSGQESDYTRVSGPAQLVPLQMAADRVVAFALDERRLLLLADRPDLARAAGVEDTSRRRPHRARDLALQAQGTARLLRRRGRHEALRIGMVRAEEHGLRRTDLHQPPEIQHGDTVRDVAHHPQVVAHEEVAHPLLGLEVGEQVEDRCLHRHVERRGRLVADDDARIAGKGTGDRDPLLQPARKLARSHRQVALGEADMPHQLAQLFAQRGAAVAAELAHRPADDAADGLAAVERGIGVLEDDLQRLQLRRLPLGGARRQLLAVELDDAIGIGRREAEQQLRQRCLAAAGFADKAQGLSPGQISSEMSRSA